MRARWIPLMTTRRTLIRTLLAASLLWLTLSKSAGGTMQAPSSEPFEPAVVQQLLTQFNVPGVSIAVVKDFKLEWAKGYGVADVETGRPVTTENLFQAASHSKTVAAMAWLKAVQNG